MTSPGATDWDGPAYDRVSAPQQEWAKGVLARLSLDGGETVLDAGCGSGRVTRQLLERLPEGRVIGEETEQRLRAAGFEPIECELVEVEPVRPEDPREFLSVVGLTAHNDRLPDELREPFAEAVVASLRQPVELVYKRLNIDAVASASS
ncbi:MAG: hypothetical protein FJW90_08670 [Actinobacteria bacterium]|nr:hypothetical protein [Actinomycetota bacterium]